MHVVNKTGAETGNMLVMFMTRRQLASALQASLQQTTQDWKHKFPLQRHFSSMRLLSQISISGSKAQTSVVSVE
jgi:hypothetical protein